MLDLLLNLEPVRCFRKINIHFTFTKCLLRNSKFFIDSSAPRTVCLKLIQYSCLQIPSCSSSFSQQEVLLPPV